MEGSDLYMSISYIWAVREKLNKRIEAVIQETRRYMNHNPFLEEKNFLDTITNTLLTILYEKSSETEEHSKRMENYCCFIGRGLQLSSNDMNELSLLALLHDIGKVCINPKILMKPGALTSAEWEEMKCHSECGYQIAQAIPELAKVADLILSHHERWDGNGYPLGLKGEEIPIPCRILAVIDAYDAMINDRVYRKAMTQEDAILEIERNAGTQFDPEIIDVFINMIMDIRP
jgi:HD-GYP domain-containing protein (c-di-GMP phosphodiesterase class II)